MTSLNHLFNTALTPILSKVSRSFYLSLRILPETIRAPTALAYLLARAADTIADTELLPVDTRLKDLVRLKTAIISGDTQISTTASQDGTTTPEEQTLLGYVPDLIRILAQLSPPLQQPILDVVTHLISGMETDLAYFPMLPARTVRAFENQAQLDTYCYDVAGVVGLFWTRMMIQSQAHLAKILPRQQMEVWGADYGKGLQLINVLKDISKDFNIGRVYIPLDALRSVSLIPEDLGVREVYPRLRPVIITLIARALTFLQSGSCYISRIPRVSLRLRLASLWPLAIGLATLQHLANDHQLLDATTPHKISRKTLKRILFKSLLVVCSNRLMTRWLARETKKVQDRLSESDPVAASR